MTSTYPITPAYTHEGPWSVGSTGHPALECLRPFVDAVENHTLPAFAMHLEKHFTPDFTVISPDGTRTTGLADAWAKINATNFSFFETMYHQSKSLVVYPDGQGGYDFFGDIVACYVLKDEVKQKVKGELPGYTDDQGRKWDIGSPICFKVKLVDTSEGVRIKTHQTFVDTGVMGRLMAGH